MSEPISFQEARAIKEQNAKLWTPLDCLKAVVRDLESGEMKPVDVVYIAMARKDETGNATSFPFATAGTSAIETRGVLAQHLHDICTAFSA